MLTSGILFYSTGKLLPDAVVQHKPHRHSELVLVVCASVLKDIPTNTVNQKQNFKTDG